jgi:hypothetical protein
MGEAIGEPDHDAYGIKMPLQFFKSYQTFRKYVAENDLRDDHNNQGDVQPSRGLSDNCNELIQYFGEPWYVGVFCDHVERPSN